MRKGLSSRGLRNSTLFPSHTLTFPRSFSRRVISFSDYHYRTLSAFVVFSRSLSLTHITEESLPYRGNQVHHYGSFCNVAQLAGSTLVDRDTPKSMHITIGAGFIDSYFFDLMLTHHPDYHVVALYTLNYCAA